MINLRPFNILDKKLYRGISRATDNAQLVSRARTELAMDFHANCCKKLENLDTIDTPDFTFTLPDISIYSDDFRKFLEKDLIECSTLNALEQSQRLNWWAESGFCRKLWPLATTGDGNCLLHAASLAMWGFHDRKLTLRSALHGVLSKGVYRDAIWRRWRFHQCRLNKLAGFVYSEVEWAKEWEEIVAMASPEPRNSLSKGSASSRRRSVALDRNYSGDSVEDDNATYESLEEVHIFALAHVLRRTIIVIADTVLRDMNGEAMAPIPFGGVYLPFEIPANECHRAPLLLTYDMAHFSALVSMDISSDPAPSLIPLVDVENILLPIQFCIDPGQNFEWRSYDGNEGNWALTDREHVALLKEYLDIVYASPIGSPDEEIFDDLTDEEYEKRIGDAEIIFTDPEINYNGSTGTLATTTNSTAGNVNSKSKAAKQLQSVAKQFGSIGKSMSKKIKKNIGSITKIGGNGGGGTTTTGSLGSKSKKGNLSSAVSTQSFTRQRILCAHLKTKRHNYQEEMIKNYLECAQDRFLDTERTKELREHEQRLFNQKDSTLASTKAFVDDETEDQRKTCCINAGCQNYGTSATSYMCQECFERQKERELSCAIADTPRYGTGNSKFYAQSDMQSHQSIKRLPSVRRLNELDQTLYLSNSTFYNDRIAVPEIISQSTTSDASFRHGYSPTSMAGSNHFRQSQQQQHGNRAATALPMITSVTIPPIDYDCIDGDGRNDDLGYNDLSIATTDMLRARSAALPLGTATAYSPGNTIIHNIIRLNEVGLPEAPSSPPPPLQPSHILTSSLASSSGSGLTRLSDAKKHNTYMMQSPEMSSELSQPSYASATVIAYDDTTSRVATPFMQSQAKPCRTKGCKFFGSANTNFYCSKCCPINSGKSTGSVGNSATKSQSKILTDV